MLLRHAARARSLCVCVRGPRRRRFVPRDLVINAYVVQDPATGKVSAWRHAAGAPHAARSSTVGEVPP